MAETEREYTDGHGVAIVYDVHPASGTPRGVVQLLHGVGEHAGRYGALIDALTAQGFIVYADDHRGHGRTGMKQWNGDVSKLGRLGPGGVPAAVAALWQFTEIIRAEDPGLPLVLLGHSWGSFMSQMLVDRHPEAYDGMVLSGTIYRQFGWGNLGDLNEPWSGPDATGLEWLASDPRVGAAFIADPLTTSTPMRELFGLHGQLRMMGRPGKNVDRDIPILLMVGRDDTVGGPRSVHKLADAYRSRSGLTDVTTLVYPDARHEIFNDVSQAEVRADLLAWLDAHFPARD
ncbi:MAG TPA: alpha/beta fold hydrolase [Microbacterium sp.]|jgi:alpha-beta hydrolase superfamily lysophospholipase|nr:alpha/beta fold hydrolase [Microbacterium sp.]